MGEFDAIVVLGHTADMDNPVTRGRVDRGLELLGQGLAPRIIMSGRCSMKLTRLPEVTEAEAMRAYALSHGVEAQRLLVEDESVDTLGNAYFTKLRHLAPNRWPRVAVVTTDIHAQRAEWIFRKILGPTYEIEGFTAPSTALWSARERAHHVARNRELLELTRALLAHVSDGDHEAVRPHLGVPPPP